MLRPNLADLSTFVAVARDRSFTRAAAGLGVSRSALSHRLRALKARLGVRLLTRTTRSVALTEPGEQLLRTLARRLEDIETELEAPGQFKAKPSGTVRINTCEHVAETIL